jgi:hypothetical protein
MLDNDRVIVGDEIQIIDYPERMKRRERLLHSNGLSEDDITWKLEFEGENVMDDNVFVYSRR